MILSLNENKYEFIAYDYEFKKRNIINKFSERKDKKTLRDIVSSGSSPSTKYKKAVFNDYAEFLDMQIGKFLLMLKEQGNEFYEDFLLTDYGDGKFCKFNLKDKDIFYKKGLYIYLVDDELMYIGSTTDCYYKRINGGYGNISAAMCYKGRRSTDCRINHLINEAGSKLVFKAHLMMNNNEIIKTEDALINKYKRLGFCKWNK